MKRILAAAVAVAASTAFAQSTAVRIPQMNLERVSLNPGAESSYVMSSGELLAPGTFRVGALMRYSNGTGVTRTVDGFDRLAIADRFGATLTGAYAINQWLQVNAQVPLILSQGGGLPSWVEAPSASGLGMPVLSLRGGTAEGEFLPLSLAADLQVALPFGNESTLGGDPALSIMPRLSAGKNLGPAKVYGEVGLTLRSQQNLYYRGLSNNEQDTVRHEANLGLGASGQLFEKFTGEAALLFGVALAETAVTTQVHLGARYAATQNVEFYLGGGPAFGSLVGTPTFRLMGGLTMSGDPRSWGAKPKLAEPKQVVDKCASSTTGKVEECPDADFDSDGVANKVDNCPMDAEDKDGFADEDGCVDADNDGDAIADATDKCPNEAGLARLEGCPIPDQDKDGIADADDKCVTEYGLVAQGGCPIKDQDTDGVVDAFDVCPSEAGLLELKGCPAKDTDTDGLVDHLDNCPTQKGLANNSGCPKKDRQLVVITKDKLEIKDRVYFGNGNARLQARSFKLLKQVAKVLKDKPHVEKVVIEGHTDDKGNDRRNLKLSQDRADTVRSYLIKQGVEGSRLETKGFGGTKPIDTNKTNAGRANNRRVEFTVPQPVEDPPAS